MFHLFDSVAFRSVCWWAKCLFYVRCFGLFFFVCFFFNQCVTRCFSVAITLLHCYSIKVNKRSIDLMRTVVSCESPKSLLEMDAEKRKNINVCVLCYVMLRSKKLQKHNYVNFQLKLSNLNECCHEITSWVNKFFHSLWRATHGSVYLGFALKIRNSKNCNGIICESNGLGVGKHLGWFQCILIT